MQVALFNLSHSFIKSIDRGDNFIPEKEGRYNTNYDQYKK